MMDEGDIALNVVKYDGEERPGWGNVHPYMERHLSVLWRKHL